MSEELKALETLKNMCKEDERYWEQEYHAIKQALEEKVEQDKKSSELKSIEEELGIDLMTLFKALKSGIVIQAKTHDYTLVEKTHNQIYLKVRLCRINNEWWLSDNYSYIVETKNYGKTWWLKDEINK